MDINNREGLCSYGMAMPFGSELAGNLARGEA
jgi:hypothetical protein